jgi:cytidyltransferase-like protein
MAKANTHLTHLEELVLTKGSDGYKMARAFLVELLKTLKGNSSSKIKTSVKWDGAPAIFAGINPDNGKFFVGTKSIFNKVPKINYTAEDVIKNHGHAPGLVDKLIKALEYLPRLNIKNIMQGDFMFDDEMIDTTSIDGEPHYRFKPNTIVYAVPVDSDLGRQISQAKFGIVFHTTYNSLDSSASFGADVSGLKRSPEVWFDDAYFTDDTGTVTLTDEEEGEVVRLVKEADAVDGQIDYDNLPSALLNIYINTEIRSGNFLDDPMRSYDGFIKWFSERSKKKIGKLKSDKGKQRASDNAQQIMQSFNNKKEDILNIFKVSRLLFEAKNIFINKYNNAVYNTKHFIDDGSGDLVASNPEGYVAVDHKGNGIKFVDRLEFSRANFAIDKGAKFPSQISEEEEDEEDDEDFDIEPSAPQTIAIVPGAFKPPHKGHLDMVEAYASMADKVIVIISKPTKRGRMLPNGKEITAEDSLAIWKELIRSLPNVEVGISSHASPLTAAYEYIGSDGPLPPGTKVILGASKKGGDAARWARASKYIKDGVQLIDPQATAVEPTLRDSGEPYSATEFRNALGSSDNRAEISDFIGEENVDAVLRILGINAIEEMASMGGGSIAGSSVPLGSGSDRPKRKTRNENLIIANEVMKLIIERGILK